jgi:hypothetical protein
VDSWRRGWSAKAHLRWTELDEFSVNPPQGCEDLSHCWSKGVGKGTGLGLSQVYGSVRQSGGNVKIYSEVGVGTSVKIYLPRYPGDALPDESENPNDGTRVGSASEVIMVVEDDDRVRNMSVEALRELGYTVIEAGRPSGRHSHVRCWPAD